MKRFVISQMDAGEVESGTGGVLVHGARDASFSGVSIDTRTLNGGNLFFAIRGAKQDGHKYIPDALSKGALGVVAESGYAYPGEFPRGRALLKVKDTHEALKDLAIEVRRRWRGDVVAITGSMGKTTTKEFMAHVLQIKGGVCRSPGNYNNLFGLPMAFFGLGSEDRIGIFEMGMSAPGEIAEMCRIAAPAIGVITNVAPVHLAFFHSLEEIARAKEELAEALPPEGTLIYNADDPLVQRIAGRFAGRKISFGFSDTADVRAGGIKIIGLSETRFRLSCTGITRDAAIPFAGAHYVMNALAAVALGSLFNLELERMIESLASLRQAPMRGQILRFKEGFTVIDDSYNSNPRALMQMIDVLCRTPPPARRVLVAGEMLELGSESNSLHAECGEWAAKCGVDIVIAVQGAAHEISRAAVEAGIPDSRSHFFADADAAASFVTEEVRAGDLVLIKGSRGVRLELIVQALLSRYSEEPQSLQEFKH